MTDYAPADLPELPDEDQTESIADVIGADLVPLSVGAIPVVQTPDGPRIPLRHATQAIGLDYSAQWRRIRALHWATVAVTTTVLRDGRRLPMVTIDRRTFIMWLATVPVTRVRVDVRPMLMAMQSEAADALDAYFARGIAVNPRGRTPEQVAILEELGEKAITELSSYLIDGYLYGEMRAGRRDMPFGETKASLDAKIRKCVRQAHITLANLGNDAKGIVWAEQQARRGKS